MRRGCFPLVFVALAWPALAQAPDRQTGVGNPAFAPPPNAKGNGKAAREPGKFNDADRLFLHAAAMNGLAEPEVAKLGGQKRADPSVAQFSERIAKDHAALSQRLSAIAKDADMSAPAALDKERAAMLDELRGLSGPAFDRRFWTYQLAEHQKAAQLLSYEIGSGLNPALKGLASEVLPTLLQRLRQIQAHTMAAGTVSQ
jgi:putative membrane protein